MADGKTTKAIRAFVKEVNAELATGKASERTYYVAINNLVEACGENVSAHIEQTGAAEKPDLAVDRGKNRIGVVEVKTLATNLDEIEADAAAARAGHNAEQFRTYLAEYENLLYTNLVEWRLYRRHDAATARVAVLGHVAADGKLHLSKEGAADFEQLITVFLAARAEEKRTAKGLAVEMARLTKVLDADTRRALAAGDSYLRGLFDVFQEELIHGLKADEFADMYAQTVAYGLFTARVLQGGAGPFDRRVAGDLLPKTNPFLRRVFKSLVDDDNMPAALMSTVEDLASLIAAADMAAVAEELARFGERRRKGEEVVEHDPVIYFYEHFLRAYDPKKAKQRGVYYTPLPVVSYIVRSIDELLKSDFGLPLGLADQSVVILDPACGTGTFLYEVVRLIHERLAARGRAYWNEYVPGLLGRLFGFELLMAPYTIAHLKLAEQLRETGYKFAEGQRLGIYLTNTLDEAEQHVEQKILPGIIGAISREKELADGVKAEKPVMVVLGNPPYAGHSANTSWKIVKGKKKERNFIGKLLNEYYFVDGEPLGERNPKWLQDDYVKFLRWAQWRIDKEGRGIVGMITNHGYLDNPTFRGMRQNLMATFDRLFLLDLHGNAKKKERAPDGGPDENVFDIMQGVAVALFIKGGGGGRTGILACQNCQNVPNAANGTTGIPTCPGQTRMSDLPTNDLPTTDVPTTSDNVPGGVRITRRHLPHWHLEGATYFVTFCVKAAALDPDEVALVLDHLKAGEPGYYHLLAASVMPDHVHVLIRPRAGVSLSRIMKGIKGVSARLLNKRRRTRGTFWQDESYDRIIRDEKELNEKLAYIWKNAAAAGLTDDPWSYPGFYLSDDPVGQASVPSDDRVGQASVPGDDRVGQAFVPVENGRAFVPVNNGQAFVPVNNGQAFPPVPNGHIGQTGMSDLPVPVIRVSVKHADLYGRRGDKYAALAGGDVATSEWTRLEPAAPFYLFKPWDKNAEAEYMKGFSLPEIAPVNGVGMTTARDHCVIEWPDAVGELIKRVEYFRDSDDSNAGICERLNIPMKKGWNITRARRLAKEVKEPGDFVVPVLYRPFDTRAIFYHDSLVWRTVKHVMRHMIAGENLGILTSRQATKSGLLPLSITNSIIDAHVITDAISISYLYPVYLYENLAVKRDRRPNLAPAFVEQFLSAVGAEKLKNSPEVGLRAPKPAKGLKPLVYAEDIFYYIYGVLHAPTYRTRYAEFLKIDFPRVPLPKDYESFDKLAAAGEKLSRLHLLKNKESWDWGAIGQRGDAADATVGTVEYDEENEEIIFDAKKPPKDQLRVGPVPKHIWEFYIGGYQVLRKWLRDRKGRKVDLGDYVPIIIALAETDRIMKEECEPAFREMLGIS